MFLSICLCLYVSIISWASASGRPFSSEFGQMYSPIFLIFRQSFFGMNRLSFSVGLVRAFWSNGFEMTQACYSVSVCLAKNNNNSVFVLENYNTKSVLICWKSCHFTYIESEFFFFSQSAWLSDF